MCVVLRYSKCQWFSGKIQRCHRWAPSSILGWCTCPPWCRWLSYLPFTQDTRVRVPVAEFFVFLLGWTRTENRHPTHTTNPRSIDTAMVSSLNSLFLLFVLQFHPPINVTPFTASTQTVRMQAGSSLPIAQQLNSCLHLSSTTDSNDDEAIDISLDERLSRVRLSRATGIEWGTDLSFSFVYVRALEPAGKTWQGSMNQTVFCLLFLSRSNSSSQELLPYQIKLKLVTRYVNCVQLLLEMESQGCQQIWLVLDLMWLWMLLHP